MTTAFRKQILFTLLSQVSRQLKLKLHYQYDGNLVHFTHENSQETVTYWNHDFGLNTALASNYAKDKVMCSEILAKNGIPTIEHYLYPYNLDAYSGDNGFFVVKPNKGGGGEHIYFCDTTTEILQAVLKIPAHLGVAISPLKSFQEEYRVTVLDGESLIQYGKTKGSNGQNNLSTGSKVCPVPTRLTKRLADLAERTTKALGLRLANVDIVEVDGVLTVLEVNGTVVLKRVAEDNRFYLKCVNTYTRILLKAFQDRGINLLAKPEIEPTPNPEPLGQAEQPNQNKQSGFGHTGTDTFGRRPIDIAQALKVFETITQTVGGFNTDGIPKQAKELTTRELLNHAGTIANLFESLSRKMPSTQTTYTDEHNARVLRIKALDDLKGYLHVKTDEELALTGLDEAASFVLVRSTLYGVTAPPLKDIVETVDGVLSFRGLK